MSYKEDLKIKLEFANRQIEEKKKEIIKSIEREDTMTAALQLVLLSDLKSEQALLNTLIKEY